MSGPYAYQLTQPQTGLDSERYQLYLEITIGPLRWFLLNADISETDGNRMVSQDELHMALVQWMTEQTLESLCRMIGEAEKFYGQIVAA
jgi:hypothetical protein